MTHILARAKLFRMLAGGFWAHNRHLGWHPIDEYRYRQESRQTRPNITAVEDHTEAADTARVILLIALLTGCVMSIVLLQWGLP